MSISVAGRVAALEERLLAIEKQLVDNTKQREENVRAIRAILTVLHPDDDHPIITDDIVPNGEWLHALLMYWLAKYNGRIPLGEVG